MKIGDRAMLLVVIVAGTTLAGCASQSASVIAATSTNLGVEIGQQSASSGPSVTLGYKRAELAIVPTNRSRDAAAGTTKDGARDTANVIMELNYTGTEGNNATGGVYQRLAVGDIAVTQGGATVMFAKNNKGDITEAQAAALKNISAITAADPAAISAIVPLAIRYTSAKSSTDAATIAKFDTAAASLDRSPRFKTFEEFLKSNNFTKLEATNLRKALEAASVVFNN